MLWADLYGLLIINCVERGTRNHIVQCAVCMSWNAAEFILFEVEIYHLISAPKEIIVIGSIFIDRGINVSVDEIGLIHVISPPDMVAMDAIIMTGLIVLYSSDSIISEDELELDHIVTNLNRIE